MKETDKLTIIGKCPVCGEGDVIRTEYGYRCNSKEQLYEKKCGFSFQKRQHGAMIDDDMAKELISKGKTGEIQMTNRIGQPFNACFVIKDKKVGIEIKTHYLNARCPVCGGRILKTSRGYACENNILNGRTCEFHTTGVIFGRKVSDKEIEDMLNGKSEILDGFTNNEGKAFSASLYVKEDGKVGLTPEVTRCPVCGGKVLVSPVAYNCSNYGNPDIQCKFSVWRNMCGHQVTKEEMRQICEEGATREAVELYKGNGSVYYKRLALSKDNLRIEKI